MFFRLRSAPCTIPRVRSAPWDPACKKSTAFLASRPARTGAVHTVSLCSHCSTLTLSVNERVLHERPEPGPSPYPHASRYVGIRSLEPVGVHLPGESNYPGGAPFDPLGFSKDAPGFVEQVGMSPRVCRCCDVCVPQHPAWQAGRLHPAGRFCGLRAQSTIPPSTCISHARAQMLRPPFDMHPPCSGADGEGNQERPARNDCYARLLCAGGCHARGAGPKPARFCCRPRPQQCAQVLVVPTLACQNRLWCISTCTKHLYMSQQGRISC
eukprot:202408-Chlamydomonas_euryale.AAC.5